MTAAVDLNPRLLITLDRFRDRLGLTRDEAVAYLVLRGLDDWRRGAVEAAAAPQPADAGSVFVNGAGWTEPGSVFGIGPGSVSGTSPGSARGADPGALPGTGDPKAHRNRQPLPADVKGRRDAVRAWLSDEGLAAGEIARRTGIKRHTVSNILKRLRADGVARCEGERGAARWFAVETSPHPVLDAASPDAAPSTDPLPVGEGGPATSAGPEETSGDMGPRLRGDDAAGEGGPAKAKAAPVEPRQRGPGSLPGTSPGSVSGTSKSVMDRWGGADELATTPARTPVPKATAAESDQVSDFIADNGVRKLEPGTTESLLRETFRAAGVMAEPSYRQGRAIWCLNGETVTYRDAVARANDLRRAAGREPISV